MSLKTITRTAQDPLVATFSWTFSDTMADTSGVTQSLGTDTTSDIIGAAKTFDVIKLPVNSIIVGGYVAVTTAFDTAGYDITIGDSSSSTRYLASTDIKGTGTNNLLLPGYLNTGGLDVRITLQSDDVCTTGVATIVLQYIIDGRVVEVI